MKTIVSVVAAVILLAFVSSALADSAPITITGEGMCAKCALHETDKCQNVIVVHHGERTIKYYLKANKVSKEFHDNLCHENHQVTATGTAEEKDGKMVLTATKIELVK